ncbi:hypothetical protein DRV84_00115 [Rhodosalinus sediminis]|jgi:hypothetical protein|uniref:CTP synthetase n=1 Tax=Rhodosalinus sediminis TaxID=1940533 RepID=A0A3D9BYW3_9RHOB|nr:hypothetical protein [Rhodosalinus sediminis]REC58679.1 hypothetical protein DRV84_00115 [Rhodosalinus sediminis]
MDRLSLIISIFTGSVLTGGIAIAAFSLGYYTWVAVAVAAVVGFTLAWPAAYLISQRIKKDDPEWEPDAEPGDYGYVPPRDAPEV